MKKYRRYSDRQIEIIMSMALLRFNTVEEVFDIMGFEYGENCNTPLNVGISLFDAIGERHGNYFKVYRGHYDLTGCIKGRIIGEIDLDKALDKFLSVIAVEEQE